MIFQDAATDDLYSLSLSSRRLHYVILPMYLSRHGILDPAEYLKISDNKFRVITTLLISSNLKTINRLECEFSDIEIPRPNNSTCRFMGPLEEMTSMERLLSKLLHVDYLSIDFDTLGSHYFVGDNFPSMQRLLDSAVNVGTNLTLQRDALDQRSYSPFVIFPRKQRRSQTINQSARATFNPLEWVKNKWALRGSLSSSNSSRRSRHSTLKSLFLETTMFFEHIKLRQWLITTLYTSELVSLWIQTIELPNSILDLAIPLLNIPSLREFSIQSQISFDVLADFVILHKNLTTLKIGKEVAAPTSRLLPHSCLSNLTTLHATPEYIVHLLKPNVLPKLRFVSILSYHPFGPSLDVTRIDRYLTPISHLTRSLAISLVLSIVSGTFYPPAYAEMYDGQLPSSHVLHNTQTLVLKWEAPLPFVAGGDALYYFPGWLANFPPNLEHIQFVGSWFASSEDRAKHDLVRSICEAYPQIKTVTLNDVLYSPPGSV